MRRSLLLLLPLLSCQDYLFEQVCPEAIRESSIERPAVTPTPADILFVVDNSGSMADEQENLAANFDRFINQIAGAGDYHIAVVTTDQTSTNEREGLQNFVYSNTYPNNLVDFVADDCRDVSPPIALGCFRGPDPATRIVDSNSLSAQAQVAAFAENVRVGSCGSGNETGLKAMKSALDKRAGCNQGFLRDNANLIVIIVSDEEDADNTPIQQYVESLKMVKGGAAKVRVAVIVGYADGQASDCRIGGAECGSVCDQRPPEGSHNACSPGSNCPSNEKCLMSRCENEVLEYYDFGCNSCSYFQTDDCCSAVAGSRYVSFALAMEQEIIRADTRIKETDCQGQAGVRSACRIATICQDNFGATLAEIARDLVIDYTYLLDPPAKYAPGVRVTVKNGRFGPEGKKLVYNTDFTVSPDGKILTLMGENAPIEGEDIQIDFVVDSENRVEQPRGACMVSDSP